MEWLAKLFEGADWWARIPAYAGLVLSIWALWRGRTVVKVRLGNDPREGTIVISNLSPHTIEITAVGVVEADGSLTRWAEDLGLNEELPKRVDARSELVLKFDTEMTIRLAYEQKIRGRCGCYVRVAGGKIYANPRMFQRRWWQILSRTAPKTE